MEHTSTPTRELLAQQTNWMRALARQLVADAHLADDLAQETLTIALQRPPKDASTLRAWLGRVMRNLNREGFRASKSREARESGAARKEQLPATDELLEKVQLQGRMADLLTRLEEPYRTTVLLRFYEGLPPRRIAERQGIPVATVKSRLNRGLAKLRVNLDSDFGDRREAWVLALTPWTQDFQSLSTLGGLALNTKLWIAAAGLISALGGYYWLQDGEGQAAAPDDEVAVVAKTEATRPRAESLTPSQPETEEVERTPEITQPSRTAIEQPEVEEPVAATANLVRGRVLDSSGLGVRGVPVQLSGGSASVMTGNGGVFEFETLAETGRMEVSNEDWLVVRAGSWKKSAELEPIVVVAESLRIEGIVVDEWGRLVTDARITLAIPEDFEARFAYALDSTFGGEWTAESEEGRFVMAQVPAIEGAQLRVVHPRFASAVLEAPQSSTEGLRIELRAPQVAEDQALRGIVLHKDGSVARNALVAMGFVSARTSASGEFVLDLERAGDTSVLRAVTKGVQPAIIDRPDATNSDRGWGDYVEVVLGAPTLSIAGRLTDDLGQALQGGRVWVAEASEFGVIGKIPVRMEAIMAGGAIPEEALETMARDEAGQGEEDYGSARPIFEPNALVYWVESDSEGRFELHGLNDRDYVLNVLDRDLHWGTVSESIAAGTQDAEIVVPRAYSFERLAGRILTSQGDPVPGVAITPWIPAFDFNGQVGASNSNVMRFFLGPGVTTDEEGYYELIGVPRQHIQFHIISEDIVPSYASVEQVQDPEAFDIAVLARVHLEVQVIPGPESPDSIQVRDANGVRIEILQMRADGYSHRDRVGLVDGRSGILTITTNVTELEFLRGGEVIDTLPITPKPGEELQIQH